MWSRSKLQPARETDCYSLVRLFRTQPDVAASPNKGSKRSATGKGANHSGSGRGRLVLRHEGLPCSRHSTSCRGAVLFAFRASLKTVCLCEEKIKSPSDQYVAKNNCTGRIRDGKESERIGQPLFFFGGCNFRKGNYLRFCRESNSQCGGQEFDPPLLHHLFSTIYSRRQRWLFWPCGQYVTNFSKSKLVTLNVRASLVMPYVRVRHGVA
jgi:hypothetical protein